METIYSTVQSFQLDLFQVFIAGLFLFSIGFWVGYARTKKLERKMGRMEKEIMDLNTELLYNNHEAGNSSEAGDRHREGSRGHRKTGTLKIQR